MKYYVIHYPKKPLRKQLLLRQFEKLEISLDDVTWLEGLNKDDYFVHWIKKRTNSPMPLGHLSCSVKHYMALCDMVDKNIQEAIVFEDDVVIHPEFKSVKFPDSGYLRLGVGVGILEPSCPRPSATDVFVVQNPGGSEATWFSLDFARKFIEHANFDNTIDMIQWSFTWHQLKQPSHCVYVCHQTSLKNNADSSTDGQCPGVWHEYCRNFPKYQKYSFPELLQEFKEKHVSMEHQSGHGFANMLMYMCDFFSNNRDGVLHDSVKDYEIGRWINFKVPVTSIKCTRTYKPQIFINQYFIQMVHPLVRNIIEPSTELEGVLALHRHLVEGVRAGLHIRRGASSSDSRRVVERDEDTFANDAAIQKFIEISKNSSPYFLASDSPETKKMFTDARTLDTDIAVVHGKCPDLSVRDRRNIFVDFFLLSMCPKVYVTGGNFPNLPGLSTFGYMAAVYGGKEWELILN